MGNGERVTRERIDALRRHAGLRPLPTLRVIESCPSCDTVHGEGLDCHGAPVAEVVALAPGERIVKPGKPRKRKQYWRPCLDSDLRAAVARDRRAGETDTDVFFRWLDMT